MTTVRLYLMTRQTLVQLHRKIRFQRVPCVGEWLRFERSGLLPHHITEVEHDELGHVEVVTGLQKDDTDKLLFHETAEDLEYNVDELVKGGWRVVSKTPNRYWGKRRASAWSDWHHARRSDADE